MTEEQKFWERAYIAAIKAGKSPEVAEHIADKAVNSRLQLARR